MRFALGEPFLVVLLAVPVGVALAVGAAHLIARSWLHPGIPVGVGTVTVVSLVAVVASALGASTAAALSVIREPLSTALAGAVRRAPSTRFSLVLRSAVVAVALAAVGNLLTSGDRSSQLLALLTPTLLALAVSVGGALLLRVVGRSWTRRTASSGGTAAYLASRRLSRRQDVASLMVPLLLAAAVLTFAAATTATSDAWRVARAQAEVGAARTFVASSSPGRLLEVTREVDPDGLYVAAAATNTVGDDMSRSVFLDTSRMAQVVEWDPEWSERSLASLQRQLTLDHGRRISFTGGRLGVDVTDVSLRSRTGVRSSLRIQYVDDRGEQKDVTVGDLRNGPSQRLGTALEGCQRRCYLEQLYVTGGNVSVSDVQGRLTISSVTVDDSAVDWGLDDPSSWRPARPFPVSLVDPPLVIGEGAQGGLELRLYLGQLPAGTGPQNAQVSGFARITPATTPDTAPALVTTRTRTQTAARSGSGIALTYPAPTVAGVSLNGQQVPMRVVDRVSTLPIVGTEGSLSDLETALVEFDPPSGSAVVTTQLLVAEGTPASVIAAVRANGVVLTDEQTLAGTLGDLRGDAFSLGLRLFLIVGAATLLIAVFGVFASAVLQSRWRSYEVASLRVVGVSQRALVRGSVLEYVVLLGVAVLLGVLSAYLSLLLVLPSLSLGTAAEHDPAPVYATPWLIVVGVAAVLFVLATLIAVLVSRRTTRLGRPSTLRWAEQG
jgi:putative ABC transport system permease protein